MKIITPTQTHALDLYTIEHEPISSLDLMERAARSFVNWFTQKFSAEKNPTIQIICGTGNNGGDGLAIARLLYHRFYHVELISCEISPHTSEDFTANLARLPKRNAIPILKLKKNDPLPQLTNDLIIDAVFGSGLNRPVEGYWADLFQHINRSDASIISVDIPSGLFANQHTASTTIKADYTYSFQFPKLSFLYPENFNIVKEWVIGKIGLSESYINNIETDYHYITLKTAQQIIQPRHKFDHKGTYGHGLLIAGSYGKMGAAILAARACLRAGCGLISVHIPRCGYEIMQMAFPEAMAQVDRHKHVFSTPPDLRSYKAIGIGPGIGTNKITADAMEAFLAKAKVPLVIDADGLNILSKNTHLLAKIPANSILTPHPKEFERLFGASDNDYARNTLQLQKAKELNCIIVLKGAHTCIATPTRKCFFNSTGNPGMGTAGSGDVLTGILTGLLAQGYSSQHAAILGVYLHGLAGDIAVQELEQESLLASDLTTHLGQAFKAIRKDIIE